MVFTVGCLPEGPGGDFWERDEILLPDNRGWDRDAKDTILLIMSGDVCAELGCEYSTDAEIEPIPLAVNDPHHQRQTADLRDLGEDKRSSRCPLIF